MMPIGVEALPLFARAADPVTSQEAAASMVDAAGHQRAAILGVFLAVGPLTADQLDDRLGWRPTTAGRRLKELEALGLARRTGGVRLTRSKRRAEVWRAV